MQFQKGRWQGNQWASIEITPVDEAQFLPLLRYLAARYGFQLPPVVDKITGCTPPTSW
ncbi:MAG: hypothetical protein H6672_14895 [Anaerolineaceae bacterium]|nr:hypothetical protein [Anaerolineaceae bacterium]